MSESTIRVSLGIVHRRAIRWWGCHTRFIRRRHVPVTSLVEFSVRLDGGGAPATLAREPVGTYDTAPAIAPAGPATGRLDRVAEIADIRDRLMGELVGLLVSVSEADDLAELTGGMSLHVWLRHAARCTRKEARDVLGAVDVLRHMPDALVADVWDSVDARQPSRLEEAEAAAERDHLPRVSHRTCSAAGRCTRVGPGWLREAIWARTPASTRASP